MDEDHLRGLFDPGAYEKFRDVLIKSLERAYDVAAEAHGRDPGFDALTFGVMVWRLSWYHAEQGLAAAGFTVDRPNNSLRAAVGTFDVHLYRAGDTAQHDIDTDFGFLSGTPTKEAISTNNARQLALFEGDPSLAPRVTCSQLVLAHTGNPSDGLCAAWLGAPLVNGDSVQWAWVTEIFSNAPPELDFLPPPPPVPDDANRGQFVAFSDQPEPDLDIGRRDVDEPGAANS
jgi:hypothetical protein